jgi:hypothetical protein
MAYDYNGAAAVNRHLDALERAEDQAADRWEEIRHEAMTCADDIHEVLFDVREVLANLVGNNDIEGIGLVVVAAMSAYGSRIATKTLGTEAEADRMPTELQAALAALAVRRH